MFRKFLRLFYTLRYIKGVQWRYQLWYRVKNHFISIHWYDRYLQKSFIQLDLQVAGVLQSKKKEYLGHLTFNIIGLQKSFDQRIDWNFQGHGKLWNYNLQYFSYLLDEGIPVDQRFRLLRDFSDHLLASNVPPEPYPVALRIVNTLLFHSRYQITDATVLEALQKQIDYLANNIEYHLLANHLLENAFSLWIASIYMSDQPLYEKSSRLLVEQLDEQILADGGHYECSVMYQSILLSKLLLCIEASRKTPLIEPPVINVLVENAAKMLGWLNAYSFPDGTWALMNDAVENIAPTTHSLNEVAKLLNIRPTKSTLKDSGYRKMKGVDWEMLIKTGSVQPAHQPGHVHADVSSFCLWYKGNQIIVDPGVSTYSISRQRNIERGTSAHNTITINGRDQSDVWGGFRVGGRVKVKTKEDSDSISIAMQPFYNRRIKHERKFVKKNEYAFIIEDKIHPIPSLCNFSSGNIQFATGISLSHHNQKLILDGGVSIQLSGVGEIKIQQSDYATSYHQFQTGLRFKYKPSQLSSLSFELS